MEGLFGFWAVALLVLAVASLFVPKLCFVKTAHPRLVGFGMYLFGMFVAAGLAAAVAPKAEKAAETQPAPAAVVKAETAPPERGIGVSYGEAAILFQELGYDLERDESPKGLRWLGSSGLGVVELTGKPENLSGMYLLGVVIKDDMHTGAQAMLGMAKLLTLACPKWDGRGDWLMTAIKQEGGTSRECNGNWVTYKVNPGLGVSLSVKNKKDA